MRHGTKRLAVLGVVCLLMAACAKEAKVAPPQTPTSEAAELDASAASSVEGNTVTITVTDPPVEIVKADADTSGKTGHFHVFIDREPVDEGATIPKEPGIVHSADNPIRLTGLTVGKHDLVVVLGDGAHQRIGEFEKKLTVDVKGPAVQATVPETTPAGQVVTAELKAEGVTIKAADADTSGTSGHFHVFIDREPTAAGQAIPKEPGIIHTTETSVNLEGLTAGEHFIWVVVGDGNHVPLANGNVAHRVTFTIQ